MHSAILREVDGAVVVELPTDLLNSLSLRAGEVVNLSVDGNSLTLSSRELPRHSLEQMLSECDFSLPLSEEERAWVEAPAVGRELI